MYKLLQIHKLNKKGFSLLELIFSVGIFSLLIIMTTGIFQMIVKGQQASIAVQDTQESMRYFFEVMSKEIRGAKRGDDGTADSHLCHLSNGENNRVFNISNQGNLGLGETSDIFYFKNKNSHCVYYYLVDNILVKHYDDKLGNPDSIYTASTTPFSIFINDFYVSIDDNAYDEIFANWTQPSVTLSMKAKARGHEETSNETKMQTTISARMYE